jgi:effector-binding domain-containing protein
MSNNLPKEDDIDIIKEKIKELSDSNDTVDLSEYQYIFESANRIKKQTDTIYEIYLNLSINILENKEDSEYSQPKHIFANHYHIPVPSGMEYPVYLEAFMDHFHLCMQNSAEQATPVEDNHDR